MSHCCVYILTFKDILMAIIAKLVYGTLMEIHGSLQLLSQYMNRHVACSSKYVFLFSTSHILFLGHF